MIDQPSPENEWIGNYNQTTVYFNITFPLPYSIRIFTNNKLLINDLETITECTIHPDYEVIKTLYLLEKNFTFDKNIGYKTNDSIFFICEPSFSLIKSVLHGIYSSKLIEYGFCPAHGSLIKFNNKTIVFYGGQKVGKTYILEELSNNATFQFGTDDWLAIKKVNNQIIGFPIEKNVSFLKSDYKKEQPYLMSLTSPNKVYIKRENLFSNCLDKVKIDCFIHLTRKDITNVQTLDLDNFVRTIIDSSYHCPEAPICETLWNDFYSIGQIKTYEMNIMNINLSDTLNDLIDEKGRYI